MDDLMNATSAASGASAAGMKLAGVAGAGFVFAAAVVMVMTTPPTKKEFLIALICTLMFSICGGSALVMVLGIQEWADSVFGLMGILGLCFMAGLPGWLIVRAGFLFASRNKNKDLGELIAIVRGWLGK